MIAQRIVFFIAGSIFASSWWACLKWAHAENAIFWIFPGAMTFAMIVLCAFALMDNWGNK